MLELGKQQDLYIVSRMEHGAYLAESLTAAKEDRVLLPARQVPEGAQTGESVRVFLYRDSRDRLIATTREPRITLGHTAVLAVKENTRIGAFLDWGLEKDLLLPFHEQTAKVQPGEKVLVALYEDKSGRLCATMKVYHYLRTDAPYRVGDTVMGRVYEKSRNFGVFVAVDDQFSALIPQKEAQGSYEIGRQLSLRVTQVRGDGKLTVSARQKSWVQMGDDAEDILAALEAEEGVLPFDDKAAPELIQARFGISKAAFKRAVGHLLKEKKIRLEDGEIFLLR